MEDSEPFQNQHYISQVLLKRFTTAGKLQVYYVKHDKWGKNKTPKNTFSHDGYTQMLASGIIDNSLEQVFGGVEKSLPETLAALDDAATRDSTTLSEENYKNICWYCAFLHCLSPFFKAKSPIDFLHDLHVQIMNGKGDLLDEFLKMHPQEIVRYRNEILNGNKIIIDAENYMQLLHRIQFKRVCREFYNLFRFLTKWTLCRSPLNLPISDIAIIEIGFKTRIWYSLPISPNLLLAGFIIPSVVNVPSNQTEIKSSSMTENMAENWIDLISLSAQVALASKVKYPDVIARRQRAKENGHTFANIKTPEIIISSGIKDFTSDFKFRVVSHAEYDAFITTFVGK